MKLVAEARQWLAKSSGQLTLHLHRLKVDSFALRRKWQNLMRPRSELRQDSGVDRPVGARVGEGL